MHCDVAVTPPDRSPSPPDLSSLPDVVWVRVLQLLDAADRSHLAATCCRLRDLAEHPSVWSGLTVNFWRPKFGSPPIQYGAFVTAHDEVAGKLKTAMDKYGMFVQHARLRWLDGSLTSAAFDFLVERLKQARSLKSVSLELVDVHLRGLFNDAEKLGDSQVSQFQRDFAQARRPPVRVQIEAYVSDSMAVNRPLFLTLLACSQPHLDLRCRSLTVLRLGASYSEEKLAQDLGVEAPVARLVSRLPFLRHLHLGVPCLCDQLLYELSDTSHRAPLRTLSIFFHESGRHSDPLPKLSAEAWSALANACPDLQVICPLLYFRFSNSLDCVLKAETPLVSVKVEDSRPEPTLQAACFSTDHAATLTTLHYQVVADQHYLYGGQPIPGAVPRPGMVGNMKLTHLVTACSRLQHLVYKNTIHHWDVLRVAQLRGRQWKTFDFDERQILTDGSDNDNNSDEKRAGEESSGSQAAERAVRAREEQEARARDVLQRLCREVSHCVGYDWTPARGPERQLESLDSFLYLRFF